MILSAMKVLIIYAAKLYLFCQVCHWGWNNF